MNRKSILTLLCVAAALTIPAGMSAQKLQLSTNVLGLACLGTLNAEVHYAVAQHWSVGVSGRFNPFSYPSPDRVGQFQLRQRCVSAGARWWPWHIYSGWWVAGKAQWQEYNAGGIISPRTEEGHRYGGGITAGYSYMISTHFNVEFGLGMWGGIKEYKSYACPKCGTKVDEGVKSFVAPNDFIVALTYVF